MHMRFWMAALLGFVLVAVSACGGSGKSSVVIDLEEQLQAEQEARAEAEKTAADEAEKRKEAEEAAADEAEKRKKAEQEAEEERRKAEQAADEAEEDLEEAEQRADAEIEQQAQTLEANQRAEKLREALVSWTPAAPGATSRVDTSVPSRSKLTFEQSGYSASSISAPALRGAKLTRSRGSTQTTVVYTDIELSRKLVDHYTTTESDTNPGQFALPTAVLDATTNFIARSASTEPVGRRLSIAHGLDSSVGGTADRSDTNTRATFSGRVHGVAGTFVCEGDGCMLTVTGTYNAAEAADDPNKLSSVTLSASAGSVYFKPSGTGSVSLCEDTSQCLAEDADYMAFGWWRSEPANAQGTYQFEPFAFGPALTATGPTASAEYNGTAVGMYVEQQQDGSAIIKKQGEFVADARLDWDGTSSLTGTIDGFKTTPTGGSSAPATTGWVVKLNSGGITALELHGPDGAGTWTHMYTTDGSAVVGTFESVLADVLHIGGAFGAQQ